MPDPTKRNLLSDIELVEYAQKQASMNERSLRKVKEDLRRDGLVYEDRNSGERRTLPNKFVRAIGEHATFELIDPDLEMSDTNRVN
jgi:hypothetical protein|tara:strand:+ start:204 stop:461 length:258 start_codon:yes stop_codon:yes gene_type:complete